MNGRRTASPQHPHPVIRSIALTLTGMLASVGLAACTSGSSSKPSSTSAGGSTGSAAATGTATPGVSGSGAKGSGASNSATNPAPPSTPGASSGATPTAATVGPAGGAVPPGFVPYSSTWVNASDGWVLGSAPCSHAPCGSVVRTTDGGRSWKGIPAPKATVKVESNLPSGGAYILRFADRSNGWAAGRGLYATHNGGATWHRVPVGPSTGTVQSLGAGGGFVYAEIYGCASSGSASCPTTASVVYAAKVGSDSWTAVSPALANSRVPGMLVVHGASWYLPTSAGILQASGTSRAVGVTRPNPCPSDENGHGTPLLAVADPVHLDALCEFNGGAGSTEVQLYGSTDGARHWKKAGGVHKMVPNDLTGLADNAHGVLLISTASGGSFILRSTDDAASLHDATVSAPSGGFAWADLGFTTRTQVAVTLPGHGLYLSHDAGASFTHVTI